MEAGSRRKKAVEQSLALSRRKPIKALINLLNESVNNYMLVVEFKEKIIPHALLTIMKVKRIKTKAHPGFAPALENCIETIWSYRRLCVVIEDIREIQFDSNNDEHERKLLKLWNLLMPNEPLKSRVSKQWQEIGFQGDNPMTDFRGKRNYSLSNVLCVPFKYNILLNFVA